MNANWFKEIFSFFKLKLKDKITLSICLTLLIFIGLFQKQLNLIQFYSKLMPYFVIIDTISIASIIVDIGNKEYSKRKQEKLKEEEQKEQFFKAEQEKRRAQLKLKQFTDNVLNLKGIEKSEVQEMYNDVHHRMYLSDYDTNTLDLLQKGIIIKTSQYTRENEYISGAINPNELKHLYILVPRVISIMNKQKEKSKKSQRNT